ncbi:hypothetical protein BH11ARM2_BH11ARM2_14120 [soil metagenome]
MRNVAIACIMNAFNMIFPPPEPAWIPGTNIQRTMGLLATSTPARRNRVKILFYGQSITRQDWWKTVEANLRRRFPNADLTVENRAIGGFAADRLKRTALHDLPDFYPDLVVLHDYGGEPDYEALIDVIRSTTAAEILVQSDHEVWTGPEDQRPRGEIWHDAHVGWLRDLARRDRLGFVDVRTPWQTYLKDHALPASSLLTDGVHLNAKGCDLMASLVAPALVYNSKLPVDRTLVRESPAKADQEIEGNRIELVGGAGLKVLIDGKPPSQHPELVAAERPSEGFAIDVPALQRVDSPTPPIPEDWTVTLTEIAPDVSHWRFRVEGSKTGPDGEGASDAPFVSKSGRVAFGPGDWYVREAFGIVHQRPPEGFQVHWRTVLRGVDVVPASKTPVTLASGLAKGIHRLKLVGNVKDARIIVYRPSH